MGKSGTTIDTSSDAVYRYGYGSPPETGMRLLDEDATSDYNVSNNSAYEPNPRVPTRRVSRSGVMLYTPNDSLPDGEVLGSAETNGATHAYGGGTPTTANDPMNREGTEMTAAAVHVPASGGAGSELAANTMVADELARVVWDLSTAAEMNPEQTTENDLELLRQMADDAKELQRQLMEQLSSYTGGDESVFGAALASNDALQNVLSSYEDIMMRVTYARQHAAAIARKESLPSGSGTQPPAPVPDLIDMGFDDTGAQPPPSAPPSVVVQQHGTPVATSAPAPMPPSPPPVLQASPVPTTTQFQHYQQEQQQQQQHYPQQQPYYPPPPPPQQQLP